MLLTPVEPKFWGGHSRFQLAIFHFPSPVSFIFLAQSYTRSVIKMAESRDIHIVPCQKYSRFAFSLSTGTTLHFLWRGSSISLRGRLFEGRLVVYLEYRGRSINGRYDGASVDVTNTCQ